MKQLEAEFWPRFAKQQSHLTRIIQTQRALPEDAPLVTTMVAATSLGAHHFPRPKRRHPYRARSSQRTAPIRPGRSSTCLTHA